MKKRDIIIVNVDGILLMSQDLEATTNFDKRLASVFDVKDVVEVKRCLGMDFTRRED